MSNRKRTCPRYRPGCNCRLCLMHADIRARIGRGRPFRPKNVFEAIALVGHDEDFISREGKPINLPPGHADKIEALRRRVERGENLFHPDDRTDYDGLPAGCISSSHSHHHERPKAEISTKGINDRKELSWP